MLIYKEELLNHIGIMELDLPFDSVAEARENILKIGLQYGMPHMWYNVLDKPVKKFLLICIGTGHDHPELTREEYIGSEIVYDGVFVWHYFLTEWDTLNAKAINPENEGYRNDHDIAE